MEIYVKNISTFSFFSFSNMILPQHGLILPISQHQTQQVTN